MSKKLLVAEVTFKQPISFKGPMPYVSTGEGWPGWNIYMDPAAREIIVVPPPNSSLGGKQVRVPFENVLFYLLGGVATKEAAKAISWQTGD